MAENTNNEQNAGAAPQQATKTKRDLALERLKTRHPEDEYADDEAIYGAINDDYDADQKELEGYKANEKQMADMMGGNPKAATFLQGMMNGGNPWTEFVKNFGEDGIDYFTDPDNAEEIGEAQAEYLKKVADGKQLDEEFAKNMEQSQKVFAQMDEEFGKETTDKLVGKMMAIANDVIRGKFTKEALDMFRLAENHDQDVADAAHEGEVRGKNSNHVKNLKLRKKDDGTANLDSANAVAKEKNNERNNGALDRAASRGNIWERGNEQRQRYR